MHIIVYALALEATLKLTEIVVSGNPVTTKSTGMEFAEASASLKPVGEVLAEVPASLKPIREALAEVPANAKPIGKVLAENPASAKPVEGLLAGISANSYSTETLLGAKAKHSNSNGEPMIKVEKIDTTRLRNNTYFQLFSEFNDLVSKTGVTTLKIQPQFAEYMPKFHIVDAAYKKVNKSIHTKQIQEADKARDDIWYGFIDAIKSALRHFDPTVQFSAEKLKILTDNYGNIAKKSLIDQTADTYNLLQDLTGEYSVHVTKLGLVQWVEELQNRNSRCNALMQERYDETAARNDTVLREARAELDKAYRLIIERINALIVVEGKADYEVFVKTWNAVIAKIIATTKGRRGAGSQENTSSDPQQEDEA